MFANQALARWMKSALVGLCIACGMASVTAQAQALNGTGARFDFSDGLGEVPLNGSFERIYTFSLGSQMHLIGNFQWLDLVSDDFTSIIASFSATIRSADGATVLATAGTPDGDVSKSSALDIFSLAAGNYQVRILGGAGTLNGYFSGSLETQALSVVSAPVPEPGAWVMMLAGLCLVGTTVVRRRPARS